MRPVFKAGSKGSFSSLFSSVDFPFVYIAWDIEFRRVDAARDGKRMATGKVVSCRCSALVATKRFVPKQGMIAALDLGNIKLTHASPPNVELAHNKNLSSCRTCSLGLEKWNGPRATCSC